MDKFLFFTSLSLNCFTFSLFKNVYKLTRKGKQLTATKVQQQDTGAQPVMNLDIHPSEHIIAAGMDNVCRLYHKPNIETTSDKVDKDGNKNTSNNKKGKGKKKQNKTEKEEIMPEMAVQQTAIGGKGDDEEYQKCVKFSRDGKFVITGASDGHVKIMQVWLILWQYYWHLIMDLPLLISMINMCVNQSHKYNTILLSLYDHAQFVF